MKECYGVGCKNTDCAVNIPLGLYQGGVDPMGKTTTWHVLNPTTIQCPACGKEYEYDQRDVVRFPCPEYPQWISG